MLFIPIGVFLYIIVKKIIFLLYEKDLTIDATNNT